MFTLRERNGFTLPELLVVLGVTIILSLVSIPSFVTLIQNHRLTSTVDTFYYNLQNARTQAIQNNTTAYVSLVTGDTWCYGIKLGSSCTCSTANSCTLTVSASAPQLISLSQNGYSGSNLSFEGTHGSANVSGSVTFTIYGQSTLATVSIGKMGNLQICATGLNEYTAC